VAQKASGHTSSMDRLEIREGSGKVADSRACGAWK
jgi:hypothetical protein